MAQITGRNHRSVAGAAPRDIAGQRDRGATDNRASKTLDAGCVVLGPIRRPRATRTGRSRAEDRQFWAARVCKNRLPGRAPHDLTRQVSNRRAKAGAAAALQNAEGQHGGQTKPHEPCEIRPAQGSFVTQALATHGGGALLQCQREWNQILSSANVTRITLAADAKRWQGGSPRGIQNQ